MRYLVSAIPFIALLSTGVYLLTHEHTVAGGWICLAAVFSATMISDATSTQND